MNEMNIASLKMKSMCIYQRLSFDRQVQITDNIRKKYKYLLNKEMNYD